MFAPWIFCKRTVAHWNVIHFIFAGWKKSNGQSFCGQDAWWKKSSGQKCSGHESNDRQSCWQTSSSRRDGAKKCTKYSSKTAYQRKVEQPKKRPKIWGFSYVGLVFLVRLVLCVLCCLKIDESGKLGEWLQQHLLNDAFSTATFSDLYHCRCHRGYICHSDFTFKSTA